MRHIYFLYPVDGRESVHILQKFYSQDNIGVNFQIGNSFYSVPWAMVRYTYYVDRN